MAGFLIRRLAVAVTGNLVGIPPESGFKVVEALWVIGQAGVVVNLVRDGLSAVHAFRQHALPSVRGSESE